MVPASVELIADSVLEVADSILEVSDSVVIVPASVELVADSVLEVPNSIDVEEAANDDKVVHCSRCGSFHVGGVFGEECYQACHNTQRFTRCGLLHADYDIPERFFHDMGKFDCEFFIPDVEKLEMRGETINLPKQVVNKLEEKMEKKLEKMKQAKYSPQMNKEDEANNE
ncbi:hypothetical protein PVAP13_4NG213600 [Panicum virgatum]|uniref:Uncharacterized protein n=1 Tax=Panicum virgatum TaxID=38727 RepID=A0A8T0T7R7_PANVG|nr:hypothetical protein PVAP13_4NG213600 [Panicum virgatum]